MRWKVSRWTCCVIVILCASLVGSELPELRAQSTARKRPAKKPTKKELKVERHLAMAHYFSLREKNHKLALKEYRAALRIMPKHLKAGLGALDSLFRLGDFKGAEKLLGRLLKQHPTDKSLPLIRARFLHRSGDPQGAIKAYRKLAMNGQGSERVLIEFVKLLHSEYLRGQAALKSELVTVLKGFLKTTRHRRGKSATMANRILAELEGGEAAVRILDAVNHYKSAFENVKMGAINGQMEKARVGFEACLKDTPKNATCRYYLGMVHSSVKASQNYDGAKAYALFEAIEEGPYFVESRVAMARFARQADALDRAAQVLRAALKYKPRDQRALVEAGIVAKIDGRDKDATSYLEQAIEVNRFSHLAQKALTELSHISPDHSLVQRAWRRGGIRSSEDNVFSSERYQSAMASLERRFGGVDPDAPENAVMETVLQRLIKGGEIDPKQPFKIQLLKTKIVNAFATPNGNIYFTRGFFDFLKKSWPDRPIDAEHDVLAQVMAHEVAHVTGRHTVRSQMFRQASKDAGARLSRSVLTHVTRIHEIEADREGMVLAFLAGYHPRGGIEMMEKKGMEREIPAHLDHPTYDERIHYLEEFWSNEVKYAWMSFSFGKKKLEEAAAIEAGSSGNLQAHYRAAIDHFKRFERVLRPVRESMNNLALAYLKQGLLKLGAGDSPLNRWQSKLSIEKSLSLKFVPVREEAVRLTKRTRSMARKGTKSRKPRPIPLEIKQSIRILKKTVRRYPTYAKAHLNLVAAYLAARQLKRAQSALEKVDSKGQGGTYHLVAGIVHAESKNIPAAQKSFDEALKSSETKQAATYNRARLLDVAGRQAEAKKAYEAYLKAYPVGVWSQTVKRRIGDL